MNHTHPNTGHEQTVAPEPRTAVAAEGALPGRRLVDGPTAARKTGCSYRHWLRLAAGGKAPPGVKLGALRRWDLDELDRWISAGCPCAQTAKGTTDNTRSHTPQPPTPDTRGD